MYIIFLSRLLQAYKYSREHYRNISSTNLKLLNITDLIEMLSVVLLECYQLFLYRSSYYPQFGIYYSYA